MGLLCSVTSIFVCLKKSLSQQTKLLQCSDVLFELCRKMIDDSFVKLTAAEGYVHVAVHWVEHAVAHSKNGDASLATN
jgi:hypothetical protein